MVPSCVDSVLAPLDLLIDLSNFVTVSMVSLCSWILGDRPLSVCTVGLVLCPCTCCVMRMRKVAGNCLGRVTPAAGWVWDALESLAVW